jgi:hypothetical protein
MKRNFITALLTLIFCHTAFSQAGKGVYQILTIPMDARSVGLGGTNVSVFDGDLNLAFNNPALLSSMSHNMLTFNYAKYLANINVGSVGYSYAFGKKGENIIGVGVNYFDYGKMNGYDEVNRETGTFTAKDINISLMYARTLPKGFTVGATLKPIYSAYERYSSTGIAADFGASYYNDTLGIGVGLAIRNVGTQFDPYDQVREKLPWNVILGFSTKFKHAPIRLSLTLHNLQRWNLAPETSPSMALEFNKSGDIKWYDMMLRHVIIGAEIMPAKSFFLSAAFNCRRRAEMNIPDFKTIAGFSFGAGVKISRFRAGFSLTSFQTGILTYHFTFSTNFAEFGVGNKKIKQPKPPTEKELKKQQKEAERKEKKEKEKDAKESGVWIQ